MESRWTQLGGALIGQLLHDCSALPQNQIRTSLPKIRASRLETVSTVRGSGWVRSRCARLAKVAAYAPTRYREVVPTVSKSGSDFYKRESRSSAVVDLIQQLLRRGTRLFVFRLVIWIGCHRQNLLEFFSRVFVASHFLVRFGKV